MDFSTTHIFRESNITRKFMANFCGILYYFTWWNNYPTNAHYFVIKDLNGQPSYRFIDVRGLGMIYLSSNNIYWIKDDPSGANLIRMFSYKIKSIPTCQDIDQKSH